MSETLIETVKSYEEYINKYGIDEQAISAYIRAAKVAISAEQDVKYGLELTKRAKELKKN